MSEYSRYSFDLMFSINKVKMIYNTLVLLRNANRKRQEPVEKHITNENYNIHLATEMERAAKENYDLAIQELKIADVIPRDWIPTFEKLKEVAMTSEKGDM